MDDSFTTTPRLWLIVVVTLKCDVTRHAEATREKYIVNVIINMLILTRSEAAKNKWFQLNSNVKKKVDIFICKDA